MKQFSYVLTNQDALHTRPMSSLMREAARFSSKVRLKNGAKSALLAQVRDVMGLDMQCGSKVTVTVEGKDAEDMSRLDGLYLAGNTVCTLRAEENCVFYIAYALYEGVGETLHIRFDPNAPLGPMHEVHGEGTFQREVFIMLGDKTPASRLLCGYTFGPDSGWTSWPPHEHAAMLEETYCYFDMPAPKMGYQITYLEENGLYSDAVAHPVRSGNMVVFPCGYHPTVASPGTRNTYLWALVALRPEDRVYGIYNKDKNYI